KDKKHRFQPQIVSKYVKVVKKKVKVKHLLSHSSGIQDERGYLTREQRIYGDDNLALEYLDKLDHLHFEPGTFYEYENPTYVLLGRLIERISNK
ncbi:MAG: serine hydrolase, partial [Treponema sp.]|nr:serine hydrolase [Treponema sp.]